MAIPQEEHGAPPPKWILAWFALDAVIGLAPPIHWAVSGPGVGTFGLPGVLVYFLATGTFITASIVAAFVSDASRSRAAP